MKRASIRIGSDEEPATPVDAKAYARSKPVAEMSDEEFDRWMETLPIPPGIRHVDDDDAESEARALADFEAGRYHDHAVVSQWFMTWGKPGYKPFEEWLAARDG